MTDQTIYTVGGTVQAGGGIYIKRKADDELLGYCRAGEFAFILSSRQVGKSSLMVRTAQQLESENIRSVIIDLSSIGVKISADEWYLGILNEIANTLELKMDIFDWWSERTGLAPAKRMGNFFSDVLLKEVSQPVVLFFDEIDSTLSLPFADDFFAALRSIHNARSTVADFKRLSFVMIGVATPGQLIADSKRTPFNIGHRVELTDFTLEESLPLASELDDESLRWILNWTGGHPYLTQRLCEYLSKNKSELTEESIGEAVKQLFEGEQGRQDNNLQFVRDMLTKRSPDLSRVLKTYKAIRMGKKVRNDERSIAKAHLKISGVVRSENGFLLPRNQIYKKVFSASWAQENIPKNWAKITSIAFGLFSFILLSVFIYDFAVGFLSKQYAGNFYTAHTNSEKLKNMASLFELEGVLQNTSYDFRARELFYSLNWQDQTSLFQDPYVAPPDKQKYLPIIVEGLYVTMANIEGGQDNSDLLIIMKDSLNGVNSSVSIRLRDEINLWLEARNASNNEDALDKYNAAILLNNNNPATHYERAIIEFRLEFYEEALLDLNATMGLAKNLSSEASEKEIATPTLWPTKTQSPQTSTPDEVTLSSITQTPKSPVTLVPPTNSVGITEEPLATAQTPTTIETPTDISPPIVREGYKSSFYSIAYIRSAVDLILQENIGKPDFDNTLNAVYLQSGFSTLSNLENAGLITFISSDMGTAVAQTQTEAAQVLVLTLFPTAVSVGTDTAPPGEPTSTSVQATDTPTPVPVPTPVPPVPIGKDWIAGCISTLWKTYPSNVPTVDRGDGCWQEPVKVFSAENGDLDFLSERGSGPAEVYGLFAPLPESETVTFTIRLRELTNVDLLMGIFAQPDVNSQGLLMIMLNGRVDENVFIQKDPLTYVTIQGTQKIQQGNGYSITFRFDNLSARSIVNPAVFFTDPLSIPAEQKWLFLGYKGLRGPYRIDGTFLNFELK